MMCVVYPQEGDIVNSHSQTQVMVNPLSVLRTNVTVTVSTAQSREIESNEMSTWVLILVL